MGQVTEKTAKLQAVWRKALREGEVQIALKSAADLHRMRFALYDSVKKVRRGEEVDAELLEATRQVVIQIRGLTLNLTTKAEAGVLEALDATLEGAEDLVAVPGPVDLIDAQASESLRRLMEKLDKPEEAKQRVTPYYTREG